MAIIKLNKHILEYAETILAIKEACDSFEDVTPNFAVEPLWKFYRVTSLKNNFPTDDTEIALISELVSGKPKITGWYLV